MFNRRPRVISISLIAIWLAALACNSPQVQDTPDLSNIVARTQTALALASYLTQTSVPPQTAITVAATSTTDSSPSPTFTLHSPTPSLTPTSIITQPANCTNAAKFESETIPDDTPISAGEVFTKTWTLRNAGTCTWTPDYALVFDGGQQMGGASPSLLGIANPPNETIKVTLRLTAPQELGSHHGDWMLATPQGNRFGLGKNSDKPFWVQIIATSDGSVSHDELGEPTWVESFDNNSSRFYLGSDSTVRFEIDHGQLIMTAFTPAGDQWRVAQNQSLHDFYLEALFHTGETCSGEDSYGMIVRAPDQADNFIDSGYVFVFSCAGKYRVYRMDNNTYIGLINWTSASDIQAGPEASNTMGIKAVGGGFELYANGELIASFSDTTYQLGYYGLTIRSKNTQDFQVKVDMVACWEF